MREDGFELLHPSLAFVVEFRYSYSTPATFPTPCEAHYKDMEGTCLEMRRVPFGLDCVAWHDQLIFVISGG